MQHAIDSDPMIPDGTASGVRLVSLWGFPRSGTTWASNVLNTHPAILYRHEAVGRTLPEILADGLFTALKDGTATTNRQYERILDAVVRAHPTHDRPPFFAKTNPRLAAFPKLRWAMWIATQKFRLPSGLYETLYTPRRPLPLILIKETRSTQDLAAILRGLRVDRVLHLIRNPRAVVASHLKGYESGSMTRPSEAEQLAWYRYHRDRDAIARLNLGESDICALNDAQQVALKWRVWNEDILNIEKVAPVLSVSYEKLFHDTERLVQKILAAIGLRMHDEVMRFVRMSKSTDAPPRIGRDASSSYYSVFRHSGFDPNRQAARLPDTTIRDIDGIVDGSPVMRAMPEHSGTA